MSDKQDPSINKILNYKNIFISLEIQNLQIDPLIIYKLLRSENCFYMQKTLPGHSAPFETIMGLKSTKIEKINGTDPIKKLRRIIEENKSTTYCNNIYAVSYTHLTLPTKA